MNVNSPTPRTLPEIPARPRLTEVSPRYLRVLAMLERCSAEELGRLKLYDIEPIQKRKLGVEVTYPDPNKEQGQ